MEKNLFCDIAIIGAGAGGLSIASFASQIGLKVILIETNKMGGDCLNTGCVPSKSFIAAAKLARNFSLANQFGIQSEQVKVDFIKVMEHVERVIQHIAKNDSVERFTALGVCVIKAHAQFIDAKTILANDNRITARHIVIATGSRPSIPPITGLNKINFLTNENVFDLREQPSHLIVIGGGPIGCELAQAFLFLGSKVTILEAFTMMPRDEEDCVDMLRDEFKLQGITIHEQIKVLEVKKNNQSIEVIIEKNGTKEIVVGSHLLIAAGRLADVSDLQLDKAGVTYTKKGIQVDKRLRTSNKRIYAIGDVIGSYQFTHIANYHASIVIKNMIFKIPASVDYHAIPWVTYTSPELAHAGLMTNEALKKYPQAKILTLNLSENDRAQTERETFGKIKVIVTPKGKILGASILSAHAGELILPWIMLIQGNQSLRHLTEFIIPYPTLNEISKRIASEFYSKKIFSKPMRYVSKLLQWF